MRQDPKGYFHPPFGSKQPVSLLAKKAEIFENLNQILSAQEMREFEEFFDSLVSIYLELDTRIKNRDHPRFYTDIKLKDSSHGPYQYLWANNQQ